MAEYIEREALIKRLEHEADCSTSLVDVLVINGLANLVRDERIAPKVDVIEVVRCKDCNGYDKHRRHCNYCGGLVFDDDFFSHGKRKEGAEE